MEERMDTMAQETEIAADELMQEAEQERENRAETPDAQETTDAQEEIETTGDAIREGIEALYEDGFTLEELRAFSMDEEAQRDVAGGMDVMRAAFRFQRRMMSAQPKRRGVPTMRHAAAGAVPMDNAVENMTDAQFEAFSRRVQAEMMAGKRVRI